MSKRQIFTALMFIVLALTASAQACPPSASGLNKCQFDEVVAKIDRIYRPEFSALGGRLSIFANWSSNETNAHANEFGWFWLISLSGGLARQPLMTRDAFALVACHEIGHHLGGPPHMMILSLSVEGQSDYFATSKCAREFFADEDNLAVLRQHPVESYVISECRKSFSTPADRLICVRSSVAAKTLVRSLQVINHDKSVVSFQTPDPRPAGWFANLNHPEAQCRLDTFFNAARDLPRPHCWFTP